MTERSIILPGADVRAILDGQKTQVRVAVKPHNSTVLGYSGRSLWSHLRWDLPVRVDPGPDPFGGEGYQYLHVHARNPADDPSDADSIAVYRVRPAAMPGDRLWVKESWQALHQHNKTRVADIPEADRKWVNYLADGNKWDAIRRPANHMPRWASRLTLEVTDVKVEQVDGRWWWVYTIKVV